MAANIHTTFATAVTLVWGSLRLAPITICTTSIHDVFPLSGGTEHILSIYHLLVRSHSAALDL